MSLVRQNSLAGFLPGSIAGACNCSYTLTSAREFSERITMVVEGEEES